MFLDGWYQQALQVPQVSENAQSGEVNPGEPITVSPAFNTFGWERPTELPLEVHPGNTIPVPFAVIDPSDFIEPVFLDGWYQQRDRQMRGVRVDHHQVAHTIADEDFEVAFDIFGWERPSTVPGPVELRNTYQR